MSPLSVSIPSAAKLPVTTVRRGETMRSPPCIDYYLLWEGPVEKTVPCAFSCSWALKANSSLSIMAFSSCVALSASSRSSRLRRLKSRSCLHLARSFFTLLRHCSVSNATSVRRRSMHSVFFKSISSRALSASCSCRFDSSSRSYVLPNSTSFLICKTFCDSSPSASFFAYARSSPSLDNKAVSTAKNSCSISKDACTDVTISPKTSLRDCDGNAVYRRYINSTICVF